MTSPIQRVLEALTIGVCIWLVATAWSLSPDDRGFGTHEQLDLAPCGFLQTTGHPCPSCGMTTSFSYMAEGRPASGIRANPAGAMLFVLVFITPFWILHSWAMGRQTLRFLAGYKGAWWLTATLLIILVSWFYKDFAMARE